MDSILAESHAAASRVSGGILQEQVSMQGMGVISGLYWLVKEEIPYSGRMVQIFVYFVYSLDIRN